MANSLLVLERLIANELGRLQLTPSATGTTTTIVANQSGSGLDPEDEDMLFSSAWAKVEADSAGTPLNVGEVRRVKPDGGYIPASGTITTSRAFSNATTTTMTVGIYPKLPPGASYGVIKGLRTYINEVLRNRLYRHYQLLTLITDGDMETSGVTNWTVTNATRTKITTAASVAVGKQALEVVCSAANGYAQSAAVNVASQSRLMHCVADIMSNTKGSEGANLAGTAKLQLWDLTNGAEIDSVSTTSFAPTTIWLTNCNIPSSCGRVAVRLIGVGSADTIAWDNVSLRPARQMHIALPSWVARPEQIESVQYTEDYGESISAQILARDARDYKPVYEFKVVEDFGAANQYRILVPVAAQWQHLFAVGHRYFPELSADTDTSDIDQDWLMAAVLARIYLDRNEANEAARWAAEERRLDRTPTWQGKVFKSVGI